LLAWVEAGGGTHPPQKSHGQVHHDGRGQIEGVGPALGALQLKADNGKAAVVTRGYGIGVVGDCDVEHQLLQGPAVGLSNALAGGRDVSLWIEKSTEPHWEGLKCK